jgi:hypothetical protein
MPGRVYGARSQPERPFCGRVSALRLEGDNLGAHAPNADTLPSPVYRLRRLKASWAAMLVTVTRATRTSEAVQAI